MNFAVPSSGDVFADMGFSPAEAEELNIKSSLIAAIQDSIAERIVTQKVAAQICGTDQATLSKILRGRMESVTIERLIHPDQPWARGGSLHDGASHMPTEDTAKASSRRQ